MTYCKAGCVHWQKICSEELVFQGKLPSDKGSQGGPPRDKRLGWDFTVSKLSAQGLLAGRCSCVFQSSIMSTWPLYKVQGGWYEETRVIEKRTQKWGWRQIIFFMPQKMGSSFFLIAFLEERWAYSCFYNPSLFYIKQQLSLLNQIKNK